MRTIKITCLSAALAVTSGCGKLKDGDAATSGAGDLAIVVPAEVNMNATFTVTVSKPDLVKKYYWAVKDAEGAAQLACEDYVSAEISCMLEFPGVYTVDVDVELKDGEKSRLTADLNVLDPAAPSDQAPVLTLDIMAAGSKVARVATFAALEAGAVAVEQTKEVTFDFSGTTDQQDELANLKFFIDFGSGLKEVAAVSTHTFDDVAVVPVLVEVHDPAGNVTQKTFNVFVRCASDLYAPVAIDPAGITITPDSVNNFFNYAVAASAITGGKGTGYKVMWDYNGDDMFDGDWSTTLSVREYTIYAGLRDVRLKVWDTGCNYFGKVSLGEQTPARESFVIPMADGVKGTPQGPQIAGYYFLQGKISGLAGNNNATTNADYIASQKIGSAEQPKRVLCDYKKQRPEDGDVGSTKSNFEIKGLTKYPRADGSAVNHGMIVTIRDIDDTMGHSSGGDLVEGNTVSVSRSGTLSEAAYFTDTSPDNISQATYRRTSTCSYDMTIKFVPLGPGTCSTNPSLGYTTILDGTWSCPEMSDSKGQKIKVESGAFFCEVAKVDACPPGGGGGGGGLPPIPK